MNPQGGHCSETSNTFPLNGIDDIPRQQIVHQDTCSPDMKSRGKLTESVVKTQRQHGQNAVIGAVFQVLRNARRPYYKVAVGKNYALWLAGAS